MSSVTNFGGVFTLIMYSHTCSECETINVYGEGYMKTQMVDKTYEVIQTVCSSCGEVEYPIKDTFEKDEIENSIYSDMACGCDTDVPPGMTVQETTYEHQCEHCGYIDEHDIAYLKYFALDEELEDIVMVCKNCGRYIFIGISEMTQVDYYGDGSLGGGSY